MATLLLERVSGKGDVRRCDAKCHEAAQAECECICGGRLHGRGSPEALRAIQDGLAVSEWLIASGFQVNRQGGLL